MKTIYRWLSASTLLTSAILLPHTAYAGTTSTALSQTDYSILFNQTNIPSDFAQQLAAAGGQLVSSSPQVGFAEVKASIGADELSKLQGITGVSEVNPSMTWKLPNNEQTQVATNLTDGQGPTVVAASTNVNPTNAKYWHYQWDIQEVTHNGASYHLGTGSHNVVVGIIDTGIDKTHPDLVKNIVPGSKSFVPKGGIDGTDPYANGDPNDVTDYMGHGTHVAGTIAGNGNILGVAPNVGIRSYKVFGSYDAAATSWICNAIVAAANDGVNVISMSLGGYDIKGQYFYTDPITGKRIALGNDVADYQAFQRALKYAVDRGVLPVVAAGNEAMNCTDKGQVANFLNQLLTGTGISVVGAGFEVPGSVPGVVTVSATGPNDPLSLYSNYGPGFITVAAPGGDIRLLEQYGYNSWVANKYYQQELCLSTVPGGYAWMAGTSMATPKVSAVAALLADKYGPMSPQKLSQMLTSVAVNPVSGTNQTYFGAGHIDAYNGLKN